MALVVLPLAGCGGTPAGPIVTPTLASETVEAYYNRSNAYPDKGNLDRAIADFDQAIKLKPDCAEAYYGRGLTYTLKGEKEKATADFKKVLELSNDSDLRQQAEEMLKELRAR